jgi:hypothetical protein
LVSVLDVPEFSVFRQSQGVAIRRAKMSVSGKQLAPLAEHSPTEKSSFGKIGLMIELAVLLYGVLTPLATSKATHVEG